MCLLIWLYICVGNFQTEKVWWSLCKDYECWWDVDQVFFKWIVDQEVISCIGDYYELIIKKLSKSLFFFQ